MLRIAFACVLMVGLAAGADDKKTDDKKADAPKLAGTFKRESAEHSVTVAFKDKEKMVMTVMVGDNGVVITTKYAVDKDGVVKATITDVEEKGEFPAKPPKGVELTFKFTIDAKGKKAKLEDFAAPKIEGAENAKPIIEGEYEAKKAD